MQGFVCANGDKKRIEQGGHIVDRSAHSCQELFAVCLTYVRIAHKFDIAVNAGYSVSLAVDRPNSSTFSFVV